MIVVDRVSKYYGDNAAVRDLEFKIDEGECVGFLGLNGAGKSTTLRLLSCLLLPTSGRITIRGFDAEEKPHEIRKLIGYLPDDPPLYPEMRVDSFLRFAGKLRRMPRSEIERRLPQVIETTALEGKVDQPIGTLSHGYKQRVGIAQAIIHNPALLILDEPIQGLDPVQILEMRQLIRALRGQHTVLLSSHILSEVERTCDRLLMLHNGRIVAQGTEEELATGLTESTTVAMQIIELEVRGAEEDLRAALAIDGVEVTEVDSIGGEVLRVRARSAGDKREELAARVVEAKIGLLALRRTSTPLEDIFVRLSQNEEEA
jgi:gliding motility-associated transport system ATP-binding protein